MINSLNNKLKLQEDLKKFGLNPRDWYLKICESKTYLIQNKYDKDFTLKGYLQLKANRPQWTTLEINSI